MSTRKRPAPRTGRPEFTPERVERHHSPKPIVAVHLRAMHLATVKQMETSK